MNESLSMNEISKLKKGLSLSESLSMNENLSMNESLRMNERVGSVKGLLDGWLMDGRLCLKVLFLAAHVPGVQKMCRLARTQGRKKSLQVLGEIFRINN